MEADIFLGALFPFAHFASFAVTVWSEPQKRDTWWSNEIRPLGWWLMA